MAGKISKAWANLPEEDQEELQRLNSEQKDERSETFTALKKSKANEILKEVRQLDHPPLMECRKRLAIAW